MTSDVGENWTKNLQPSSDLLLAEVVPQVTESY